MKKIIKLLLVTLVSIISFQSCTSTFKKGQVWTHYENNNPFDSTLWYIIDIKRTSRAKYIHYEDISNGGDTTVSSHYFWNKTDHLFSEKLTIKKPYKLKSDIVKGEEELNNDINELKDIEENREVQNLDLDKYPDLKEIVDEYKYYSGVDEVNYPDLFIWINKNYYLTKK